MTPGLVDQRAAENAPCVLKAPSSRTAFFSEAAAPTIRLQCLIFGFLLSLAACQSAAGPIANERPMRLSGADENISIYLLSIEDDLESVVRWARPVNCDSKRIIDGSESDCYSIDRAYSVAGMRNSVRDPLDVKAVLDDIRDVSSVGLADYGVMPDGEGLWVRVNRLRGNLAPISKAENGASYFRLKVGEIEEIEVLPLVVPSSVFGARKSVERSFYVRLLVSSELRSVGACYQERTPGSLKAFEVTPSDRAIDLPFGEVSLFCASTSL